MGLRAELVTLLERAHAGDAATVEGAVRRAASIRDVLAGARDMATHQDVRAALDDGLVAAEETSRELEGLVAPKRTGTPSTTGTEPPPSSPGPGAAKRQVWPPSAEVIDQASEGLEKLAAGVTSVLGQLAKELSKAADEFSRTPNRCRRCGATLGDAKFCPRCGAARG